MQIKSRVFLAAIVAAALLIPVSTGCSQTSLAKMSIHNEFSPFHIEVYSGGKLIHEYHTNTQPHSEDHSDGWSFVDKSTGKLTRVSGDVIVTQEDSAQ